MSNERIDFNQYEGMKEWEVEKRPDGGYAIKTGRDNFSLEEAETIVKLPTLIAELKKMYEREDALVSAIKGSGRIDLTQFEGMIGGPWLPEWLAGADTDNEEPSAAIHTEDYGTIAQTFYRDWDKPYEATTKAIAAVPDLIAELKRCYDFIDRANESMKVTRERVLNNTENWNDALFQEVIDALLLLD